jgi:hypothetical protein
MAPIPLIVGVTTVAAGAVGRAIAARRAAWRRARKPQLGFKRILLDNTDAPFPHGATVSNTCTCGPSGGEVPALGGAAHAPTPAAAANCPVHGAAGACEPRHPHAAAIERLLEEPPLPCAPAALEPGHAPAPPAPLEDTPLVWVSREGELREAVAHLAAQPRFAMDLEHSPRAYHGVTCLIQISTGAHGARRPGLSRGSQQHRAQQHCAAALGSSGSRQQAARGPACTRRRLQPAAPTPPHVAVASAPPPARRC